MKHIPTTEAEVQAAMDAMCWHCAIKTPLVLMRGGYFHQQDSDSVNGGFRYMSCPWKPDGELSTSDLHWWSEAMKRAQEPAP